MFFFGFHWILIPLVFPWSLNVIYIEIIKQNMNKSSVYTNPDKEPASRHEILFHIVMTVTVLWVRVYLETWFPDYGLQWLNY